MDPSVKPEQDPGHVPTYAEWQAAQYGPHRFGQDPTAQLPMGRTPTYAEWQQLQQSPNPSALRFPALPTPKFVADQTKRLNPNAGKPDQSILESLQAPVFSSEGIKKVAAGFDAASAALGPMAGAGSVVGPVLRQAVAPAVEHPIATAAGIAAAAASPIVVGGLFTADMLHNVAKYGYQTVHEQMMTPEERAVAQQDPNRISGEAAAVQAVMAGLSAFGVGSHINQELSFTQSMGMREGRLMSELRPWVLTTQGASDLGNAAAAHQLPPTASPYPPESPLSAAWRDGYDKPRVQVPGTVEQVAPPVPQPKPVEPLSPAQQAKYKELSNYEASLLDAKQSGPDPWTPKDEAKLKNIQKRMQTLVAPEPVAATPTADPSAPVVQPEAGAVPPEPIAPTVPVAAEPTVPPAAPTEPAGATPVPTAGLTPIEGTGETRTRGLSAGVEEKAVENKLTSTLGDLPQYQTANMADHAAKAVRLLNEDPVLARKIALGEADAPAGMIPEAVFVAVENKAIAEGDVATIRDLATGKLTEQATTMGQRIRTLGERDPESPVSAIQKIVDARGGGKNVRKMVTDTVKEIQAHLGKTGEINKDILSKFIDSLRC